MRRSLFSSYDSIASNILDSAIWVCNFFHSFSLQDIYCVFLNIRQCLQWMHVALTLFLRWIMFYPVSKCKHTSCRQKIMEWDWQRRRKRTHQFWQIQIKLNSLRCDRIAKNHRTFFPPPWVSTYRLYSRYIFVLILYRWLQYSSVKWAKLNFYCWHAHVKEKIKQLKHEWKRKINKYICRNDKESKRWKKLTPTKYQFSKQQHRRNNSENVINFGFLLISNELRTRKNFIRFFLW